MNFSKRVFTLAKKEFRTFFNSITGYFGISFFLITAGVWFFHVQNFLIHNHASLNSFFALFPYLYVLIIPAFTMRVWSEEFKSGTDELLLTLPFTVTELVMGKYIPLVTVMVLLLLLTLPMVILLTLLGDFDRGVIITQYIGVFLLGKTSIAVGITASALSKNQLLSFIYGASLLLLLTRIDRIVLHAGLPSQVYSVLQYLSLSYHSQNFTKGILDTRNIFYFFVMTIFFLYSNMKIISARKRG